MDERVTDSDRLFSITLFINVGDDAVPVDLGDVVDDVGRLHLTHVQDALQTPQVKGVHQPAGCEGGGDVLDNKGCV